MLRPSRRAGDSGFTLIELTVTVALMGVVVAAVVGAIVFVLSARTRSTSQLSSSADRQIVSSYFVPDVEGASGTMTLQSGSTTVCGSAVSSSWVLTLRALDYDAGSITPVPVAVSYVYQPATMLLQRLSCRGSGAVTPTTVAHNVSGIPSLSGSCTSVSPFSGTSRTVALTVPEVDNPPVVLCARRRAP